MSGFALNRESRKRKLSDPWIRHAKAPAKPIEHRDTETRGLILRLQPTGRKTFIVAYTAGGRERRYTIGPYGEVSLSEARAQAERVRGRARGGDDPQAEREQERVAALVGTTVSEVVGRWLAAVERTWKQRTRESFASHIRRRILRDLGTLKIADVKRAHVLAMLDRVEGPATRNRCLGVTKLLFRWALGRGIIENDPTAGVEKLPEEPRERDFSDEDLVAIVRAFDGTRWRCFVRLLLLTGARRDELLGAQWDQLDANTGVLTIPRSSEKAGRKRRRLSPRTIILSKDAGQLLKDQRRTNGDAGLGDSPWIFPTRTGNRPHRDALKPTINVLRGLRPNGKPPSTHKLAKAREQQLPDDVRLHDFRHAVASRMLNHMGVSPFVVDAGVLGHVVGGILGVYAHGTPILETRKAMEAWARSVSTILSGEQRSRVVPLRA